MIKWVRDKTKYSNGYIGSLNKLPRLFYIGWDLSGSGWILTTKLPGIKILSPINHDIEILKLKAESALNHWLDFGGLTIKRIKINN